LADNAGLGGWYRQSAEYVAASAVLPIVTRREAAMVAKINALADDLDTKAAEKSAQLLELDEDDWAIVRATKKGIAGAWRDAARQLRGLVSGDNQAVRDGD
jgi:hypothetical protein